MALLEIRKLDGETTTCPLVKQQPVTIGRHATCDVQIDEENVAVLHCRISFAKDGYEVAASSPDGVEVNGTSVSHAVLQDGDLIRVGSLDIVVRDVQGETRPADAVKKPAEKPAHKEPPAKEKAAEEPTPQPPKPAAKKKPKPPEPSYDSFADVDFAELPDEKIYEVEELTDSTELSPPTRTGGNEQQAAKRSLFGGTPARPGEQDITRSPLTITLGVGIAFLLLSSATVWLIIGRDSAQRQYDAAIGDLNSGRYAQAIERFNQFLQSYPRSEYSQMAQIGRGRATIEAQINGSSPDWPVGLKLLQDFVVNHRDYPDFEAAIDHVRRYAELITLGAAKKAEVTRDAALLEVARDAHRILDRYSPDGRAPAQLQREIRSLYESAEAAILKSDTFSQAISAIEKAIANKDAIDALVKRRQLLDRYGDFRDDPAIVSLLERILEMERGLVTVEEVTVAAKTTPRDVSPFPRFSLTPHIRPRSVEASMDRRVLCVAKNCLYVVDSVGGLPLWRRAVGYDLPFFPFRVAVSVPAILLFDTVHSELVMLNERSGELIWRQECSSTVSAQPLVHQGQIYVPTRGGRLLRLDAETGELRTVIQFPRPIAASPILLGDGEHLVLAGDQEVLYTLTLHPLECGVVSFLQHRLDSIRAPLLVMSGLVLVIENDRADSALLRVLDASIPGEQLRQVASQRVAGQVTDTPLLRGRQLFVPSERERLAVLTVSDDPDQRTLALLATHQVKSNYSGKAFLSAGADGQLWMAASALQKFNLATDSIRLDPKRVGEGISSQPIQHVGESLFVARQFPYTSASILTEYNRNSLVSQWRTTLGSSLVSVSAQSADQALGVCETGEIVRLSDRDWSAEAFKPNTAELLPLSDHLQQPVRTVSLAAGRTAVYCGLPKPHLWVLTPLGKIERERDLPEPLEADPVEIAAGIVLPLPERLAIWPSSSADAPPDDFIAPLEAEQAHRWQQLAVLDDQQIITLNQRGRFARLQWRLEPEPHLASVAQLSLKTRLDVPLAVHDGNIYLADLRPHGLMIEAATFDTAAEVEWKQPATNELWVNSSGVLVEMGGGVLHCYDVGSEWTLRWQLKLPAQTLAGRPLWEKDRLWVACRDGQVMLVDSGDGGVIAQCALNQPLAGGPRRLGNVVFVTTADGTLINVQSLQPEK